MTLCEQKNLSIETIKQLLDQGADPNSVEESDWTPLHILCYDPQIDQICFHTTRIEIISSYNPLTEEAIKLLIENSANVNVETDWGETPLHLIFHNPSIEVVKLLLDNNANPNITDKKIMTPLHIACNSNSSVEVIKVLLCSFFPKNMEKKIQSYFCCMKWYSKKIKQNIPKPIQRIILNIMFYDPVNNLKKYIKSTSKTRKTCFNYAEEHDNQETLNFLNELINRLEHGNIIEIWQFLNSK